MTLIVIWCLRINIALFVHRLGTEYVFQNWRVLQRVHFGRFAHTWRVCESHKGLRLGKSRLVHWCVFRRKICFLFLCRFSIWRPIWVAWVSSCRTKRRCSTTISWSTSTWSKRRERMASNDSSIRRLLVSIQVFRQSSDVVNSFLSARFENARCVYRDDARDDGRSWFAWTYCLASTTSRCLWFGSTCIDTALFKILTFFARHRNYWLKSAANIME